MSITPMLVDAKNSNPEQNANQSLKEWVLSYELGYTLS
jgi:hypothetical protein